MASLRLPSPIAAGPLPPRPPLPQHLIGHLLALSLRSQHINYLTHAKRSNRLIHVSANTGQNQDSSSSSNNNAKVDRRNVLLGLGGMYGESIQGEVAVPSDAGQGCEVDKTVKGKANESLVLDDIVVDTSKFLKFYVFINDEDDARTELDKAAYAGTYAQVPHKTENKTASSSITLRLTELYEDMDVEDDDTL